MSRPRHVILTDFGSTYTKVAVADLEARRVVMTDRFPSTVATDARVGLTQCFDAARAAIGESAFLGALKLSSSSAAGGLRMGVVGLSRSLSAQAGKSAAFGAGGKILCTLTGRLTEADILQLEALPLEILLFCGGYESGGTAALLHNAQMLAESSLHIPIIYAGNSAAAQEVRLLLSKGHKECWLTRNIIPDVGRLDKEPVEEVIRQVFLRRIINMKGLDKVSSLLDRMVMPTPAAVLAAGELLARGTANQPGLGDLMIVDVGGATTDVHSYVEQISREGAKLVGAPEPYAKRTVEGDLGMRESAGSLAREIGMTRLAAAAGLREQELTSILHRWTAEHDAIAETAAQQATDRALTAGAVYISARRHSGYIEHIASAGMKTVQHGKNLASVRTVIGTGGPLVFGAGGRQALRQVLRDRRREPDILLPEEADLYLDGDYILFAAGLLGQVDEDAALVIMKNSLQPI